MPHITPQNFVGENFDTPPTLVRGSKTWGTSTPPNPWLLVDNELCETVVGPNFEQHQFSGDKNNKKPRSRASILKELRGICGTAHCTGPPPADTLHQQHNRKKRECWSFLRVSGIKCLQLAAPALVRAVVVALHEGGTRGRKNPKFCPEISAQNRKTKISPRNRPRTPPPPPQCDIPSGCCSFTGP